MAAYGGVDTTTLLVKAMNTAELRHKYLANNIANVETPNYTPKEVDFQATLRVAVEGRGGIALRTTRPRHFDFTSHRPAFDEVAFSSTNDYNKVDLDDQMAKLSENTGRYTTFAMLLTKRFDMVKNMLSALQR